MDTQNANVTNVTNEQNVENVENKPTDVVPQKTNEEKLNDAQTEFKSLALQIATMYGEDKPQNEIDEVENKRYDIKRVIDGLKLEIENEKKRIAHQNAENEYLNIINELLSAYDVYNVAKQTNDIESDEYKNALTQYNDVYGRIKTELSNQFNNIKRVIHAPMGATGNDVKRAMGTTSTNDESKNATLQKLMSEGKTNDELLKMGYIDGTIRYARWQYNKKLKSTSNGK